MSNKQKTAWLIALSALLLLAAAVFGLTYSRAAPPAAPSLASTVEISAQPDPTPEPAEDLLLLEDLPPVLSNPTPDPEPTEEPAPVYDYILNTNTRRFHWPDCRSVTKIKPENMQPYTGTRDDVLAQGFIPCGNCKP